MQPSVRRKKSVRLLIPLLLAVMWMAVSCYKDIDFDKEVKLPQWNPNLAAPAISAKLTIADLLQQTGDISYLQTDSNGFLTVYHRSTLLSQYAGELITFDTQKEDTTISLLFPLFLPVGDSVSFTYKFSQAFSNSFDDVVDSIRFKEGNFEIEMVSMMDRDVKLVLISPSITKNDVPLRVVIDLDYMGALPVIGTANINLKGYNFSFKHVGNKNNLDFYVDVILKGDNNPNPGPFDISVFVNQSDLKYRAMFGQIKTRTIELLQDVVEIDFFKKGLGGKFWINDPRIGIHFRNSFGLPVGITIDPLKGHSDVTAPYDVHLSGSGLPNPFMLNSPTLQEIGQHAHSSLTLNKNNSNIDDFLNLMPQRIEYGIEAVVNPTGLVAGNFLLDTSQFQVDLELEIPLEGYAGGFTLQDTIEFSFDTDSLQTGFIDWVLFRIFAESTFPVEAVLQVTFLDSLYNVLDSLFDAPTLILPGAFPGPPPLYLTSTPVVKTSDVKLAAAKIAKLKDVRYFFLTAHMNTASGGNKVVRIYTDQYLQFKVGVQTKLKISPDEL